MTHTLLSVLVLAAALAIAEGMRGAPVAVAAAVLLLVTTLAAVVASRLGPLAVASGALAALGWLLFRPIAAPLAGASLVLLALLARTVRVASAPSQVLHAALSITGGGIAAWANVRWLPHGLVLGELAQQLAALVISALALGLPFLLPSEDPETHALLSLAQRSRGAARSRLLRAVVLRRKALGIAFGGVGGRASLSLRGHERRALARAFAEFERAAQDVIETGASARAAAESLGMRLSAIGRAVRALSSVDAEEKRLEARSSGAAELAQEHADARREALRALTD